MRDDENLRILGFNSYEAKIYLVLLQRGKLKVSQLLSETAIPSNKIYENLRSLEEKGLVAEIQEKVKYYISLPLNNLKELINDKRDLLESVEKRLEELSKLREKREDGEVVVLRNQKNFYRILSIMTVANEFSYSIKWKADVNNYNNFKSVESEIKRGVDCKVLYSPDCKEDNIKKWAKFCKSYSFIETDKVALNVNENDTVISIANTNTNILIRSKSFSKVMQQLFDGYYKNSLNK